MEKEYLSIPETRATLGASRAFIYKLIAQGLLPVYKVGRRTYFKIEDVKNLFKLKESPTPDKIT